MGTNRHTNKPHEDLSQLTPMATYSGRRTVPYSPFERSELTGVCVVSATIRIGVEFDWEGYGSRLNWGDERKRVKSLGSGGRDAPLGSPTLGLAVRPPQNLFTTVAGSR